MASIAPGRTGRRRPGFPRLDHPPICHDESLRRLLRCLPSPEPPMNTALVEIKEPVQAPAATGKRTRAVSRASAPSETPRLRTLLALPVATLIALAVHLLISKNEPAIDTRSYSVFLGTLFG